MYIIFLILIFFKKFEKQSAFHDMALEHPHGYNSTYSIDEVAVYDISQ